MNKLEQIKSDVYFRKLIEDNNLSDEFLNKSIERLYRIYTSRKVCVGCQGLKMCKQLRNGERLGVIYDDVFIEEFEVCKYGQAELKLSDFISKYVYCDVPEKLYKIDLANVIYTKQQEELYYLLAAILHKKENKGLYIVGDLGVGKTYLCVALANSLVKNGEKVAFVNVSNFFNEMKSFISTAPYMIERNINTLKKVTYLFLDDIGSESVSDFVRDDILLNILEYRMNNEKTTIFTSNLNKSDLLHFYAHDRNDKTNIMKASRLIERIDILSNNYTLIGPNKRRD